ncbi:GNAT family N-acetyltransferase [Microlunatus soli]|uniref:N-acetyltransferase domain-containing protein n=1 Tax=Microlunatus soli TaxID=630515 RepID=A0A1H1MEI5_9ACTN|nr:GNAT family N-acetyltransferase [Microlunatus soli]SDR85077.1 hypothetical protein SAMN04489812_0104 [Microlunatus soli]
MPISNEQSADLRIVPANRATAADLDAIYGTRGPGAGCRCQRYKLGRKESFRSVTVAGLRQRQLQQAGCDTPGQETSGLVGYLDDEPVAWCAIEPRPDYQGLVRVFRVPWDGRDEDRTDRSVWAITCLYTRVGFRRRGISGEMAAAAVEFAREHGAAAVEGYPIINRSLPDEGNVGTPDVFRSAGLSEVHRPSLRRLVMRIDFDRS